MYLKVVKKTSTLDKNRNFKKKIMKIRFRLKPYFLTLTVPFTVSFK